MLMPSMRRVDSMERRDSGLTVWHSAAASALHETFKMRAISRAKRSDCMRVLGCCAVSISFGAMPPSVILKETLRMEPVYHSVRGCAFRAE